MKKTLAILLCLLAATAHAQTDTLQTKKKERKVELWGEVYDSFTKAKLAAHITLMRDDSTVVDTATCTTWQRSSFYQLSVPAKNTRYILKATLDGYEDTYMDYQLAYTRRKNYFELPRMLMKKKADPIYKEVELDGVAVTGTKVKMVWKGDTIVYNASAFNLPEGSMLDGLVRQLPGAELRDNGDIYINGEKIDYLTLNGTDFFKGKNQVMLDNLPYYTVQNIKVYHKDSKKSQLAGRAMERKDHVMDVQLKREYNRGYMANAEAGTGTRQRYMARLFALAYDDHTRLTLYGNMNNVNETRKPGSDGEWTPANMPDGLTATRTAGMELSTEDSDKRIEEELSLQATWTDADNESHTRGEQFTTEGLLTNGSHAVSRNKDFRFSLENKFTLNKPLRLYSTLALDVEHGNHRSRNADSTFRNAIINQSRTATLLKQTSVELKGSLAWYHEFEWGDALSLNTEASYNRQKPTDSFTLRDVDYAAQTITDNDFRHRELYNDTHSDGYQYSIEATYGLQLPDKWAVMLSAAYQQSQESAYNTNYRLDWLADATAHELGWLPSNSALLESVTDTNHYDTHHNLTRRYTAELMVQHSTDNKYFHIRLPLRRYNERMHFIDITYDTIARRSDLLFEPELMFFTWGKNQAAVTLRTQVERPDFPILIEGADMTNPLITTLNNPDLKNRITHTLYSNFTFKHDSLDRQWHVGLTASLVQRAWGTSIAYRENSGMYIYMTDNVNGNWNAAITAGINGSLDHKKRLRYQLDTSVGFVHSVDFAITELLKTNSDELSRVNTLNSMLKGKMEYNFGSLTAGCNAQINLRNSRGNLADFERIDAADYRYGLNAKYNIPWLRLDIATDLTMFSRRGYATEQMNTDNLVWNAQIAHSLLKNRLTLRLQAFDLLHQLASKQYSVNAQGRTESWTNCIPRYLMLSAIVKLSKK